ncbi:hypothetical protein C0991_003356 [Blastosporella zonata]|nr:hypothetical protein C0991_003356 [Blastosporella zonata]
MSDNRYWLFPANTIVFVFTPWDELPFHSLRITEIHNKNLKSLEGYVINTRTAWDTIQFQDTHINSPFAYCVGKIEDPKTPKKEGEEVTAVKHN